MEYSGLKTLTVSLLLFWPLFASSDVSLEETGLIEEKISASILMKGSDFPRSGTLYLVHDPDAWFWKHAVYFEPDIRQPDEDRYRFLPGVGIEIDNILRYRTAISRSRIGGADVGILRQLNLKLREGLLSVSADHTKWLPMVTVEEAVGVYEITSRPHIAGRRQEMLVTLDGHEKPLRRKPFCARLLYGLGMVMLKTVVVYPIEK